MSGRVSGRRRAQAFDISLFGSSTTFLRYGRRVESRSGRTGCSSIRCRPAICVHCIFRICTIFLASCSPLLMYRRDFPVPSSNLPLPPAIKRVPLDVDYDIGHGRTVSLVTSGPMCYLICSVWPHWSLCQLLNVEPYVQTTGQPIQAIHGSFAHVAFQPTQSPGHLAESRARDDGSKSGAQSTDLAALR